MTWFDLRPGDQLVADGVLRASVSLQADESLLTGESEPVEKRAGDRVLSGSFVVAGSGGYQATEVGAAAYARKLAAEARRFTLVRSELMEGINRILRYVTWAIVPVAALMLISQLHVHDSAREALTATVAALVGMVPQGLVLLTSVAFGVAAVTLARRRVLVQQLPAVEGLARVDVVCFDKTGTLTDGTIAFDTLIPLDDHAPAEAALGALADEENQNATLAAIGQAFPPPGGWARQAAVPFSSPASGAPPASPATAPGCWEHRRWCCPAASRSTCRRPPRSPLAAAGSWCWPGPRGSLDGESLPPGLRPAAFVVFAERLRSDAAEAIAYFAAQGVALKVISGDSPLTVSAVAKRAGLPQAGDPVDARDLPEDPAALGALLEERSVFGRVSPHQKQAMVKALRARGHTVAMTGDGVNDVLALKLADLGIAMGSGAPATKAVAELVLLDGRFATLPGVVAEGRRVTANIERVANLFITKTVWATLLAVAVGAMLLPYPFLPRHLTIIDTLAIGVPSFFLALAPNRRRYRPGFAGRVLRFAIPAGEHRGRSDVRRVLPGPGGRPSPHAAAHRRHAGYSHSQRVRAGPAGHAADLAPDRPGGRGGGRLRAAVPGLCRAQFLRAGTPAQRNRGHAAYRSRSGPLRSSASGCLPAGRPAQPAGHDRAGRSAADDPCVLVVRFRLRVCGAPGMRCSAGKACSTPRCSWVSRGSFRNCGWPTTSTASTGAYMSGMARRGPSTARVACGGCWPWCRYRGRSATGSCPGSAPPMPSAMRPRQCQSRSQCGCRWSRAASARAPGNRLGRIKGQDG